MKHAQNVFKDIVIMFQMESACNRNAIAMLTIVTQVWVSLQRTITTHAKIALINAFNVPIQHGVIIALLGHIL